MPTHDQCSPPAGEGVLDVGEALDAEALLELLGTESTGRQGLAEGGAEVAVAGGHHPAAFHSVQLGQGDGEVASGEGPVTGVQGMAERPQTAAEGPHRSVWEDHQGT